MLFLGNFVGSVPNSIRIPNSVMICLYVKSQNPFKVSFKLKLCSFASVPYLFKKEINAFDSFRIECLVVTVLSVDVSYGNTLVILFYERQCYFEFIVQLLLINSLKPLKI